MGAVFVRARMVHVKTLFIQQFIEEENPRSLQIMINDNDYSLLVTCGKAANGRMVVRMKEFAKCAI